MTPVQPRRSSERKRVLGGVLAACGGTAMVLSLLVYMNQQAGGPDDDDGQSGSQITVEKKEKPPPKQPAKPPKPPKQQPNRAPAPPSVDLSSVLSGMDFGLPGFDAEDLSALNDSLLGDGKDVVMTDDLVDVAPRPTLQTPMVYPPRAKAQGITGYVMLSLLISPTGQVEKVKVLEAEPAGIFEETAAAGVQGWKFEPASYKGEAVRVWAKQRVRFDLS